MCDSECVSFFDFDRSLFHDISLARLLDKSHLIHRVKYNPDCLAAQGLDFVKSWMLGQVRAQALRAWLLSKGF